MSVTLADLYQSVGVKLEIVRSEENISAEDGATIAAAYEGLHDQMLTDALVTWGPTEEVPNWSKSILVDMLAAILVDEFGVEEPRRSLVRAEGMYGSSPASSAEKRLRKQLAAPYIDNRIQAEQF